MSILTTILILLTAIIVIILIAAALLPDTYTIERETIINQPKQQVFNYIKILNNQQYFNKWVMADLQMRQTFTGTDGAVGFIYAWDSDNKQVGKGEQEIKAIADGEQVDSEVRFMKPFEGKLLASFITTATTPGQTRVRWIINGQRNFMMRVFHLLFNLRKTLGKDMLISMDNLKSLMERAN